MKFNLIDLSEFSDVGTVVCYQERKFYTGDITDSDLNYLLDHGRSEHYLFSTSITSEYVDFGKTGFLFPGNLSEKLLPNLFDYQETLNLSKEPKFDSIVSSSFPRLSRGDEEPREHFFGKLSSSSKTAYLIHLPRGTWKVEVYNSRVSGNCGRNYFIDYDILKELSGEVLRENGIRITQKPALSIYFGPSYDVSIQDFTLSELLNEGYKFDDYLERYLNLTASEYESFPKNMSVSEYLESYREEVLSEKMLYIVNTPDGKMEDINFYSLSYPESKNPHPHMSEAVVRNDYLWSGNHPILESPNPGVVIDSRSGVLLGLRELKETESSWFTGAISRNLDKKINGKVWEKAGVSDVFGENPEISPWWYCPDDLPNSMFRRFYVITKGKGYVSPSGLVYLGPGNPLKLDIVPGEGYRYLRVTNAFPKDISKVDSQISIETPESSYSDGHRFEVIFEEILYSLNFQISCLRDYPRKYGSKNTYSLTNLGDSMVSAGIKLIYLTEYGTEAEFGSPKSTYNKLNLPKVSDTKELYFRLDFSSSAYEIVGDLRYPDETPIPKETINDKEWYVLRISDFPKSIIEKGENIIPIGDIVSKKYTVLIKSFSGIQISTPKRNIMEYHNMDPSSQNPISRPFITKMILGDDNTVEVWKNGRLEKDGWGAWSLTKEASGIWTFEVFAIDSNYEIIVK